MNKHRHILLFVALLGLCSGFFPVSTRSQNIESIIFIPGIMGSVIDSKLKNCNIWPRISGSCYSEDLVSTTQNDALASDIVRKFYFYDIYGGFIDYLKEYGHYVEYPPTDNLSSVERCEKARSEHRIDITLFSFAYDWRMSNDVSAKELASLISCIQELHPGGNVNIIAHSMGGLVARAFIKNSENGLLIAKINKVITIGTPWIGTPQAIDLLTTGKRDTTTNFWISINAHIWGDDRNIIKGLVETHRGPQELLPSRFYVDALEGEPLSFYDNYTPDPIKTPIKPFSWWNLKQWLNKHSKSSRIGDNVDYFHTFTQDNWNNDNNNIQYYIFYGIGNTKDTLSSILNVKEAYCKLDPLAGDLSCTRHLLNIPTLGYGDKTVTVLSASRENGTYHLNGKNAQLIPIQGEKVEHTKLVQNTTIRENIIKILSGLPIELETMNSIYPKSTSNYDFSLSGTSVMTVTDSIGNSANSESEAVFDIDPIISYHHTSDIYHMAVFSDTSSFTVTLQVEDLPIHVVVNHKINGVIESTDRYVDINLPQKTKAVIRFYPGSAESIYYDRDNNGTYETQIIPDLSLTGNAANDMDRPTITFDATGSIDRTTVMFDAKDNKSINNIIYYSLDGKKFYRYQSPFVIDAKTVKKVFAFAQDETMNRSSLLEYPTREYLYVPLVVK